MTTNTDNTDYATITVKLLNNGEEIPLPEFFINGLTIEREYAITSSFLSMARSIFRECPGFDTVILYCDGELVMNLSRGD